MLTNRRTRAIATTIAILWFATMAAVVERLYHTTIPAAASCLEATGQTFPPLVLWWVASGLFLSRFWLLLVLPIAILAIAPRSRPFAYLPIALLGIALLAQIASAWAIAQTAEVSVACLTQHLADGPSPE